MSFAKLKYILNHFVDNVVAFSMMFTETGGFEKLIALKICKFWQPVSEYMPQKASKRSSMMNQLFMSS